MPALHARPCSACITQSCSTEAHVHHVQHRYTILALAHRLAKSGSRGQPGPSPWPHPRTPPRPVQAKYSSGGPFRLSRPTRAGLASTQGSQPFIGSNKLRRGRANSGPSAPNSNAANPEQRGSRASASQQGPQLAARPGSGPHRPAKQEQQQIASAWHRCCRGAAPKILHLRTWHVGLGI